ncbi:trypsin-like serine peptidase [Amycolatopsis tolypomycina]|uniref:trypsin-like serine peptidase n=1 Tax=Amycolatopsis tolypomycina TaxID=208445 RepID=UPI0033BF0214
MIFKRRSMLAAISAMTLAASMLITVPATAGTVAKTDSMTGSAAQVWDESAGAQRTVSAEDAQRIVSDYWTPSRLASAVPAAAPAGPADKELPALTAKAVTAADPALPTGDKATRDAWFSYTNGKIYYVDPRDSKRYMCSGSAVNSGSKRLVVTAGHCAVVGGGNGQVMLNWIFIPGYDHGSEPRGRFSAYWFHYSTGWSVSNNWQRDFAFVVTNTNGSGQKVVNAAGGHGFRVNGSYSRFVHIAGYPGDRDSGEVQWYCWGTTDRWPSANAYRLGCNFGGGSSGGPWLEDYQSNGLGYVISAMQGNLDGNNSGPYYDNHVLDVFNAAKDHAP